MSKPVALTIAGSDSGGGAGVQADLKTYAALDVYGTSAITALTAQNTRGVTAVHNVPARFVTAQIDAVFSDFAVRAVKTGMVSQTDIIEAIAHALDHWNPAHRVVDPVMVATSGDVLLAPQAIEAVRKLLLPRATILTPNLQEAATLLDAPLAATEQQMEQQGRQLLAFGPRAVLIKGGHGQSAESVDILVMPNAVARLAAMRVDTRNTHGTGCTLSAAIAAELAKGGDLETAVRAAKSYVTAAIAAADSLGVGGGRGPLHHFHAFERGHGTAR
ncbi:MAG: bifunctional hydroxymethylpyrimidine kinase/phosphomethylpyrimidine kinase [Xanthobacteraceae bacterium]|nr:MAG: bifunctional hydroxymethylpyrimidine kinase/phosphomethylpyrimidine kinase [Xanthobacteraceae bacterium]